MTEIKSEDLKKNDRVELSGYFDVHVHGNGFQLRREDRTYSIIPFVKGIEHFGTAENLWEVSGSEGSDGINRYDSIHDAIEAILDEEEVSVKVESIKEYYNIEEEVQNEE
jgi:hypothetical protein